MVTHAFWYDQVDYLRVPRGTLVEVVGEEVLVSAQLFSCIAIDSDDALHVPLVGVVCKLFIS